MKEERKGESDALFLFGW